MKPEFLTADDRALFNQKQLINWHDPVRSGKRFVCRFCRESHRTTLAFSKTYCKRREL